MRTEISASVIGRVGFCAISVRRSQGLQSVGSEYSNSGDRCHKALSFAWDPMRSTFDLTFPMLESAAERETCEQAVVDARAVITRTLGEGAVTTFADERRFYGQAAGQIVSAQPDLVLTQLNSALIIDWKTGWKDQIPAEINAQLRMQAVLVSESMRRSGRQVSIVYVALIHPHAGRPTIAAYTVEGLLHARKWIEQTVEAAFGESPNVSPGWWCQYCPAAQHNVCPDFREAGMEISAFVPAAMRVSREAVEKVVEYMPLRQLGAAAQRAELAQWVIDAVRRQVKVRQARGEVVPHCRVVPGRQIREIKDTKAAWEAMAEPIEGAQEKRGEGLTAKAFLKAATVTPAALEDSLKELGVPVGLARTLVKDRVGHLIHKSREADSFRVSHNE